MSSVFKGRFKKSKADPSQKTGVDPPTIRDEEARPEFPPEGSFHHKAKEKLQNIFTGMGSIDRAPEGAIMELEDESDNSTPDEISGQVPQCSIQVSKHQVRVMHTTGGGAFPERKLDEGKGRDNQVKGLGGAGGLSVIPGHLRQDYDNLGTPEAGGREISRNQMPPSTQGVASHFQGAHHVAISGGPHFESIGVKNEYNYANQPGTYDIPILKEHISFSAIHDSSAQDPTRRVHPGTRRRVLKSIRDWIATHSAKERIFWLHGPAGVGKSAIAQTIAHSCARESLAGTFFFYRSDPSRNNGDRLFPTLAWQFAYSIPATKTALIRSLIERPDICTKAVETQFEELIIKPFLELKRSGVQLSAPVVIIDGVDECSEDSLQRRFLKIIGNAGREGCVPLRFLICSRPEAHIQDTIDIFQSFTLPLDLAKLDDANNDIEKYLRAEFSRIATEQGLEPAWPGEKIIQELVYKASGQFIYASTVIKYVGDEYSSAESQLDIVRGLKPVSSVSPFAELDELYKEILRRQRDPVFLTDFLSLFIGRNGTGLDGLHKDDSMLMNVSEKELDRKLRGMRSVLKFTPYINVHHRSFLEFLHDSSRSGQYHISKQTGARRYLALIADSLVRHTSTVIEGYDDHQIHFTPNFHHLTVNWPSLIVLPVEEWQQALQPLLDLQTKLLSLPNFCCAWEFLPCKMCIGFLVMRNLLLHFAFVLGASVDLPLIADSRVVGPEEFHSSVMPFIPTETRASAFENDLNTCLSSLLLLLHRRTLGVSLSKDTIRLVLTLLCFDHAEIAMKLRSTLDAQILVDVIDEVINSKYFFSDCSTDTSCKAVHLALEIHARVPVIPHSLFSKGTVGPQHDVWCTSGGSAPETELLFQTAFICKILDPSYIVRVLWLYEDDWELFSVVEKVNEKTSLSRWQEMSNPSAVTRIRVIFSVAKALRYFHSMGIVLHSSVDSDDIFLDSEFHARFRFLGFTARYINTTPESHEANIFLFGCLLYEMCFAVKISLDDRLKNNSNAVAKCPSTPEIRDDEWQLIQRCCAEEPKSRPTMDDVVREMEAWDIS